MLLAREMMPTEEIDLKKDLINADLICTMRKHLDPETSLLHGRLADRNGLIVGQV